MKIEKENPQEHLFKMIDSTATVDVSELQYYFDRCSENGGGLVINRGSRLVITTPKNDSSFLLYLALFVILLLVIWLGYRSYFSSS